MALAEYNRLNPDRLGLSSTQEIRPSGRNHVVIQDGTTIKKYLRASTGGVGTPLASYNPK